MKQWESKLSQLNEVEPFAEMTRSRLIKEGISQEEAMDIQLSLLEVLNNCFLHGKSTKVQIRLSIDSDKQMIQLEIEDDSLGYDVSIAIKDEIEEWDILNESGKGLFLIHQLLDDVWFNETGNHIVCKKQISL